VSQSRSWPHLGLICEAGCGPVGVREGPSEAIPGARAGFSGGDSWPAFRRPTLVFRRWLTSPSQPGWPAIGRIGSAAADARQGRPLRGPPAAGPVGLALTTAGAGAEQPIKRSAEPTSAERGWCGHHQAGEPPRSPRWASARGGADGHGQRARIAHNGVGLLLHAATLISEVIRAFVRGYLVGLVAGRIACVGPATARRDPIAWRQGRSRCPRPRWRCSGRGHRPVAQDDFGRL